MQSGVCPLVTLNPHDPTICVEGSRVIFFNRVPIWKGVLKALLLWYLLSHETQNFSCSPKRLQAKTLPRNSPFPYQSLNWPHKQLSILAGKCTHGFKSLHLLAAALSFRICGTAPSLHVAVQEPCAMLYCIIVSQRLEPREAHIPAWDPTSRSRLPTMQSLSP